MGKPLDVSEITVPYWHRFCSEVLAVHPEWAPFILGEKSGHGIYSQDDRRFFLEIPSQHPTRKEPLTIEIADRDPVGPIDVYWDEYFEHVFKRRDLPLEEAINDQFSRVVTMVDEWMSGGKVFSFWYCVETGRKTGWGRLEFPFCEEMRARATNRRERIVYWSWDGSCDGEWPT